MNLFSVDAKERSKDLKLLPCNINTQQVNKQAISCKKSGFVLSVWMSWTRYCLCIYALKFQDEEEDGSEVEDEESESEVGEERVLFISLV